MQPEHLNNINLATNPFGLTNGEYYNGVGYGLDLGVSKMVGNTWYLGELYPTDEESGKSTDGNEGGAGAKLGEAAAKAVGKN
jgi:hypothetical protein